MNEGFAEQSARASNTDERVHVADSGVITCEREPIHAPGAVQSHGAMLVVLLDGLRVSHASANTDRILGTPSDLLLGRALDDVIGKQACRLLLNDRMLGTMGSTSTTSQPNPQGGSFHFQAHRTGRYICVDIEQVPIEAPPSQPVVTLEEVLKTFEYAGSGVELCELAVNGLKAISGYDRVMAYQFVEAGHGEVIAEARESHLEPYLGLRYPASDIPPQARRLYTRQRVGSIADSAATPVLLLADPALDDGTPLDLTHSTLRSASPIHREYMRNMKTAASLTIGLVQGTDLWGMLVCHHGTSRVAPAGLRAAAGAIGLVVSLLLAKLDEATAHVERLQRGRILRELVEGMDRPRPLLEALGAGGPSLLHLVGAGGVMLQLGGRQLFFGSTPDPVAALSVLATLQSRSRGDLLAIDDVGLQWPELEACTHQGSGALLLRLASGAEDALLWFRPEEARSVTWGGNPSVHGDADPASNRMSPRASFKEWKETVRGRCTPWTEIDIAVARDLGAAILAESTHRTKVELRETQARLGLLAENSGVVVILSDLDGTRRYVSPAAERVLGWHPEDLVGRSAMEFIHPDDQKGLLDANDTMMSKGQSSASYRFRRPNGTWLWIDGHARRRANPVGEPPDYVVVLRDATERKASEKQMLEALDLMEKMATTDGLTDLSNRRQLDLAVDREWRRCAREQLPLSVLLLDADRFKLFNDRYGHPAGDDCLRAIASQLTAVSQRPGDVAARYGGEEFMLLLPGTDQAGAVWLAERLRRLIHQLNIAHEPNAGFGVVTVSIGVATAWPGDRQSDITGVSGLFKGADAALYRAKCAGRNQVIAHQSEAGEQSSRT